MWRPHQLYSCVEGESSARQRSAGPQSQLLDYTSYDDDTAAALANLGEIFKALSSLCH